MYRKISNNKAVTLIGVIIMIVFLSIVALGIVVYISEGLKFNTARINQEKALYAAQAGIMKAVVDYVNNGSMSAETDTQITDNIYYSIGGAGMFFLADCSNPMIVAVRKLINITMTNVNAVEDVTITHMQVSWTPDGAENLISIDLGRGVAEWSGTAQSGTNVDMIDYTIGAGTTENDVWLDWELGSDITSMTITAVLTMSDGSTVEIMLLDEGLGSSNAVVITSTGKVVTSDTWKRTLKANYDVGTSKIISWEESQGHL